MMNRNLHIIVSLVLCLCLLTSCTAAKPVLDEADMPPAGEVDKLGDDTDPQNGDGGHAQPSGSREAGPSVGGDAGNGGNGEGHSDAGGDEESGEIISNANRDEESDRNLPDTGDEEGTAEADINAVDRIRHALQKEDPPVVNDELIEAFFYYYIEDHGYRGPYHRYELRTLPDFGNKTKLDWDGLVLFSFMLSVHELDEAGYSYMPKETLEKTVNRLFSGLEYTHRSSSLFDYADNRYTATGWDYHGRKYYRLREISKNSDGTFEAAFDGFYFYELDTFDENYDYSGENMKALFDYADEIKPEDREQDLILEIFLRDDYADIMHVNERVDITFKLSDDPEFAFRYLSCKREWLDLM